MLCTRTIIGALFVCGALGWVFGRGGRLTQQQMLYGGLGLVAVAALYNRGVFERMDQGNGQGESEMSSLQDLHAQLQNMNGELQNLVTLEDATELGSRLQNINGRLVNVNAQLSNYPDSEDKNAVLQALQGVQQTIVQMHG